jgi:hypothetical protein
MSLQDLTRRFCSKTHPTESYLFSFLFRSTNRHSKNSGVGRDSVAGTRKRDAVELLKYAARS